MTELLIALLLLPSTMFEKFKNNTKLLGESVGDALSGVLSGLEKMDTKTNQQDKDDPGV